MSKFVVSTKKSLFKSIEIEIDGKIYSIKTISPAMLEKASQLESDALDGDIKALIEQLRVLTGIKKEIAMKLDVRDISELLKFITNLIFNPEKVEEPEEKNVSKPAARK